MVNPLVMLEALLAFFLTLGGFNTINELPADQQAFLKGEISSDQLQLKSSEDQDAWKAWSSDYEAKEGGVITIELGAS